MGESRDLAIKLFGKTIPLQSAGELLAISGEEGCGEREKDVFKKEGSTHSKDQDHDSLNLQEKSKPPPPSSVTKAQKSCADQDTLAKDMKPEEQKDMSSSQEETPKKPGKRIPCPRCNNMDTKFCYFNNYNINQACHLCKNCQRYWTDGRTMRNVPVGAGCLKSKNANSLYRHITMPDTILQTVRSDCPLKPNGTALSFGSDAPIYESMAFVSSLAKNTMKSCNRNEFNQVEEQMVPIPVTENCNEHSSASSVTASSSTGGGTESNMEEPNYQVFAPQSPYYNGFPWPYPWSPAPVFCTSSFSIPVHWGCAVPGNWSIPWLSPLASSPNSGSAAFVPNSPMLGKHLKEDVHKHNHSENGSGIKQINKEGCFWVTKTLRIDDTEEAAMSYIWEAMGLKTDKADTSSGGGLCRAFQARANFNSHTSNASQILHANPAALSRSLAFQESS